MKAFVVILMLAIFSLGVCAINCERWECNATLYSWADFSNPIFNDTEVADGQAIVQGNWTASGNVAYSSAVFNTTPVSIAMPGDYTTGYIITPWTNFKTTNASCIDIYFTEQAGADEAGHVIWSNDFSNRFPATDGTNCPDPSNLCYYADDTPNTWIDTGMSTPLDKWITACVYWNGTGNVLYLKNDTINITLNPPSGGFWDLPFNDGASFQVNGYQLDSVFYLDNFRNFNYTQVGQLGIPIEGEAPPVTETHEPSYYNTSIPEFFNKKKINADDVEGTVGYVMVFIILMLLVAFSEYIKIPIMFLLSGLSFIFFSLYVFVTVSSIAGIILGIFGGVYILRMFIEFFY